MKGLGLEASSLGFRVEALSLGLKGIGFESRVEGFRLQA